MTTSTSGHLPIPTATTAARMGTRSLTPHTGEPRTSPTTLTALVAPDKFKGSLTAAEVADAIAVGLQTQGIRTRTLPLADGGDGSVEAAVRAGWRAHPITVRGASGQPVQARWAEDEDRTAIVEVAATCGLATLTQPPDARSARSASSYGVGQAILAAIDAGVRRVVLALGGSASTDGGAGLLAALGLTFRDRDGQLLIPSGGTLTDIATVEDCRPAAVRAVEIVVASDVANPLLGSQGAAPIFGPQKGAGPAQVEELTAGLAHLVDLMPHLDGGPSPAMVADRPGAGAAGGLGFAAQWLGGHSVSGASYFLDLLDFDAAVRDCDLVVTGEGGMDDQTAQGKLPAVVANRSQPRPVYAVVGNCTLDQTALNAIGITQAIALRDLTHLDSRQDPELSRRLVRTAAENVAAAVRAART